MRSFKHWTPRYVADRVSLMIHERRNPGLPWLTPTMVRILSTWLRPADIGLEWGSGRSTKWFARRVSSLISIEHDSTWFQRVKQDLANAHISNVDYRLLTNEDEYVNVSNGVAAGSRDFVLVDGVFRDRCAVNAIPLLRPGGILIIDNCNWYLPNEGRSPASRRPSQGPASEQWKKLTEGVSGWRHIWTSNGVTDTAFWQKPTNDSSTSEQRK